ncbi:MAG: aminotransferase class III-fold pyridoxal phosphate-dependent enzyme [Planctomycetes bacterium]|nr:aminotransferase class III-fold pyridoxal phosphate-dependent enzyme [Planctomycetota bacterium]
MMEPLRSEMPPEGYLEGVQSLTRERDVILIFDEVSTGFRLSAGGVQPALGITPDMAVFAKSLSNGYSMGAVVGNRNVMEPASKMFVSSTYWSDTVGIQAALTTLQEIRKRDIPAHLDRIGSELKRRINSVADETGAPVTCEGLNVSPSLKFERDDPQMTAKLTTLYIQEMAKRGCHGYTAFCPNGAHGADEVEETIASIRETFTILADAAHNDRVDELLECRTRKDSIRRLVR